MNRDRLGTILWRAAADEDFRSRTIDNLGIALAQEGFVVSDDEMNQLRSWWDEIERLSPRAAMERIQALARSFKR